mgnify:CR=1 FL=1
MLLPLVIFALLLWLGRENLEIRGILVCLLIFAAIVLTCVFLSVSPYVFTALLALMDVVLVLIIFGSDIPIR